MTGRASAPAEQTMRKERRDMQKTKAGTGRKREMRQAVRECGGRNGPRREAADCCLPERRSIRRAIMKTAQFLTMEVAFED